MPAPTSTGLAVDVGGAQPHLRDLDRMRLADVARRVLGAEGIGRAEVSIAVVDDRTIHAVNRRHLDHDWPTDVISFVLSEPGAEVLSGEVVVSAETAVRTAARDGVGPWTELVLYVIHGLLHLCGHDDLTEEGAAAMRRREGELLAAEGLSHPYSPTPAGPLSVGWAPPTIPGVPDGGQSPPYDDVDSKVGGTEAESGGQSAEGEDAFRSPALGSLPPVFGASPYDEGHEDSAPEASPWRS